MLAQSQTFGLRVLFTMFLLLSGGFVQVHCYETKDNPLSDVFLSELLNRMAKDIQVGYYDVDDGNIASPGIDNDNVDLVSRSEYARLCGSDSRNADCMLQALAPNPNPSLRDQEFLQHSSLWGHQFVSGGMGEMPNRYNTIVKTDASLPAYCNPPNPCPEGYDVETQGANCIADFENTAIFSRQFQAGQECTCDSEHMFDCSQDGVESVKDEDELVEQFLRQFGHENAVNSNGNNLVKKAGGVYEIPDPRMEAIINPFLEGDRLPIAAKKGNMLFH
ncbi:neuroendocrine protein 7B2 [Drosophila tropicalis]|uniref:neuroendocrine protein 7B2 n=1 Tax=Drosophila tropicalis TaxID=46794 RepID=UPI0035ABBAF9